MSGQPAAPPLTGGSELLERAISYTRGTLHAVTPDALSNPTPCAGWDLRALLAHMDDSLSALCQAADIGRVDVVHPGRDADPTTDTIERLRVQACRLLSWSTGNIDDDVVGVEQYQLPATVVTVTGALEIAVHGWDVAVACGAYTPIPAPLAERMLMLVPMLVADDDRPLRFGAQVPVPSGASPSDRLVAFLGRDPGG